MNYLYNQALTLHLELVNYQFTREEAANNQQQGIENQEESMESNEKERETAAETRVNKELTEVCELAIPL